VRTHTTRAERTRDRAHILARERQRRYRENRRRGLIVVWIKVDEYRVLRALIAAGMSPAETCNRHAVEAALGDLIRRWERGEFLCDA
jgi:hypothetical protein